MHDPSYYRDQADRARRLADAVNDPEAARALYQASQDYDDVAEDLESGAVEIRHPDLMPQTRR
jgi:hypothetical protein